MDTSDQNLTLDDFLHWSHDALGSFLTKRGFSKDGTKNELVALCFAASKMKLPILPSESELENINRQQYVKMLEVESMKLPDPFKLYSDWYDESSGISKWPPIFITDITNFMMQYESKEKLTMRLNEYKVGKAYEYFKSNWLKEVFYHDISSSSEYCFLRSQCTPSQRVNNEEHSVWICASKKDGVIKAAYCTCTAGFGQTCNHVAGLLFRIEAANNLGITSSTSNSCGWNVPKEKTLTEPAEMKDLIEVAKKSKHGRPAKSRPLVGRNKKEFEAVVFNQPDKDILNSFVTALHDSLPNACFLKGIASTSVPVSAVPVSKEPNTACVDRYYIENLISETCTRTGSTDPEIIETNLPRLTQKDVNNISDGTFGQFSNPTWFKMRHGRITSSQFYSVYTRVESILSKPNESVKSLLSRIMGYTSPNPNIKSLKQGRENEPYAKEAYKNQYIKYKKHDDISFEDSGLLIDANLPYIASSPDLLVSCRCCGLGMVEIKCCMVPPCSVCSGFCKCNLPDCLKCEEYIGLKKNHAYFGQIQGQLAITGRDWCDLYIYTCNGSFTERVVFDNVYYQNILHHLKYFFTNYVLPEILTRNLQKQLQEEPMEVDGPSDIPMNNINGTIYFCPVCNRKIKEPSMSDYSNRDQSVACDKCHLWYHFTCVHMTKAKAKLLVEWVCPKCTK